MKAYLDNGATTKVADEVVKEMNIYLKNKYGNPSSLHSFGEEAFNGIENARKIIADKLKCDAKEIIFTSGGTESNNLAIKEIAFTKRKGKIITSKFEHHSVLETCKFLEVLMGFKVVYLNIDKNGFVDIKQLEKELDSETILVSIMHANNEIGTIQDIKKIYELCKKKNVLFHTDAVQSFCKIDLDCNMADMISISAHKIHGPKGVGALYVNKNVRLGKLLHGGHQENDKRAGTENVPGIVGFGKAVEIYKDSGMSKLRDKLMNGLLKIDHSYLNGSKENRLANNVNVRFSYVEGESILMRLNEKGIAVSTGSACSSKELQPSHVLTAIGLKPEEAHGSIRFTLSKYTTNEEIAYVLNVIPGIIKNLREMSPLGK